MEYNKSILDKIITNLRLGEKGNLDFAGYDHKTKTYKYQTEVNLAVSIVSFNRTLEEAIELHSKEVKLTTKPTVEEFEFEGLNIFKINL